MRNGILWMLHRVAPADSEHLIFGLDSSLRVSPDYLEMQIIRAKEQGARFLSIDDFLANKRDGTGRPTDVCITIDDGFKDIYDPYSNAKTRRSFFTSPPTLSTRVSNIA